MVSRKDEKAQRRAEREAAEAQAARAAKRSARLRLVLSLVAALVALGWFGALALMGDNDKPSTDPDSAFQNQAPLKAQPIPDPDPQLKDLSAAAQAAGCELKRPAVEGSGVHSTQLGQSYNSNPPTSGTHHPQPAPEGTYAADNTPPSEHLVHTLEHGRVILQYKAGQEDLAGKLKSVYDRTKGYHLLIVENNTNMPYQLAATSWGVLLGCEKENPKVWDALTLFAEQQVDKAPEFFP